MRGATSYTCRIRVQLVPFASLQVWGGGVGMCMRSRSTSKCREAPQSKAPVAHAPVCYVQFSNHSRCLVMPSSCASWVLHPNTGVMPAYFGPNRLIASVGKPFFNSESGILVPCKLIHQSGRT
ncbi:hypothetical protein SRHO_G00340320 [Serrasalmus rhombeus]